LARYREPVCRICRREGMKLFLKGDRCFKEKCAIERRNYAPGQHGQRQRKLIGYGLRLREKQKVRSIYGLLEAQFHLTFLKASRMKGVTGENLLQMLERRLDNAVYRLGYAASRAAARQLVGHGHVCVNGHKVDIPSFLVKVGHEITLKEKALKNIHVQECVETAHARGIPAWLELDENTFTGRVVALPTREDVQLPIQEQFIVELYSK